jgi:hypothetical protein
VFRRRRRDVTGLTAGDTADAAAADEGAQYADGESWDDEDAGDIGDDYADEYETAEGEQGTELGGGQAAVGAAGGRHRRAAGQAGRHDLGDPETWTKLRDAAIADPVRARSVGPWDSADSFPARDRLDLGCLHVPVSEGSNVQLAFAEETGLTLAVVAGESALQLQAFAAPRSSGLWDKVRPEISAEVAKAGGRSQEQDGPFGRELLAWVTPPAAEVGPGGLPPGAEGQQALSPQPLRFLGADGPRWFLRGLISGPAAADANLAGPLEEVFADIVVVRGDFAAPPEAPLEIQLPEEARQAFEDQIQEQQPGLPNPFERGPEITETR